MSRHPLSVKRKTGPQADDAQSAADAAIEDAAKVLTLVDSGQLAAQGLPPPISIAVDRRGKPRKPLSAAQERELATRIQSWGCVESRQIFVLANMGLVHMVARQFSRSGIRHDDLTQEGVLGLIRATETFEPGRGVRFSTYCVHWIRAKIQRLLQRLERDDMPRMTEAPMETMTSGRRMRPRAKVTSLQDLVTNNGQDVAGSEQLLEDTISDESVENQGEVAERFQRRDLLLKVFDEVSAEMRDRRVDIIVKHRLLAEEPETLAEIGNRMALSREGARLLEGKVLELAKKKLSWELDGDSI